MRVVDWHNRKVRLEDLKLQVGQLVRVEGHVYRYSVEKRRDGVLEHVLCAEGRAK